MSNSLLYIQFLVSEVPDCIFKTKLDTLLTSKYSLYPPSSSVVKSSVVPSLSPALFTATTVTVWLVLGLREVMLKYSMLLETVSMLAMVSTLKKMMVYLVMGIRENGSSHEIRAEREVTETLTAGLRGGPVCVCVCVCVCFCLCVL